MRNLRPAVQHTRKFYGIHHVPNAHAPDWSTGYLRLPTRHQSHTLTYIVCVPSLRPFMHREELNLWHTGPNRRVD